MRWRSWVAVLSLCVVGCDGLIEEPPARPGGGRGPGSTEPVACELGIVQVSPRALRRLTPEQYRNSVRDLLGDPGFDPAYDDGAVVLTERGLRQLRDGAELVVSRRAEWTADVFPCDTAGAGSDACVGQFLDGFAARAFRRPLTPDEREWLTGVHGDARAAGLDFGEAMEVLLEVVLQAPAFVYVHETGIADGGLADSVRRLTDHELAARLGYFLWNTTPDGALLDAAARGALSEPAGLRAEAERLLADPRAEATLQRFFWTWLQLDGGRLHNALDEARKDPELFPQYDDALKAAMRTELEAFVDNVLHEQGASFDALLTSNRAYVNGPLAEIYGVEGGPTSPDDWRWVDLEPAERSGLLTRAAFLTVFASHDVQSPIRRGVFVIEEMLCNDLGEPPPNASDTPVRGGEVDDGTGGTELRSVRQDVAARTAGSPCNTCHGVINPAGFSFEHYDAIGRWRSTELTTGLPIDSTGELRGSDVDGPLTDAVDLSRRLAGSQRVRGCMARRLLTRALGEAPGELDRCALLAVERRFAESGSVTELVLAIVESDAFRHVATEAP